jgi:hypothetical protein
MYNAVDLTKRVNAGVYTLDRIVFQQSQSLAKKNSKTEWVKVKIQTAGIHVRSRQNV